MGNDKGRGSSGGGGVMPLGEGVTHHGVGRGGQCGQTHT